MLTPLRWKSQEGKRITVDLGNAFHWASGERARGPDGPRWSAGRAKAKMERDRERGQRRRRTDWVRQTLTSACWRRPYTRVSAAKVPNRARWSRVLA